MWNSLSTLEKLYNYRAASNSNKTNISLNLSISNIKDKLLNASSPDELDEYIENAKKNNLDVVDILEEAISLGNFSKDLVQVYTTKLEYEKMIDQITNMRYKLGKGAFGIVYRVSQNKVVKERRMLLWKVVIFLQEKHWQ